MRTFRSGIDLKKWMGSKKVKSCSLLRMTVLSREGCRKAACSLGFSSAPGWLSGHTFLPEGSTH